MASLNKLALFGKSLNKSVGFLKNAANIHLSAAQASSKYYPINDDVFGLDSEQQQLRKTVFNFVQTELAPKAAEIDATDDFKDRRV